MNTELTTPLPLSSKYEILFFSGETVVSVPGNHCHVSVVFLLMLCLPCSLTVLVSIGWGKLHLLLSAGSQ